MPITKKEKEQGDSVIKDKEMIQENKAEISFDACSINEGFARMAVAAFMMDMNPTLDELQDVKTAVSEAVTNAIVHGYFQENEKDKHQQTPEGIAPERELRCKEKEYPQVKMICLRKGNLLTVIVSDSGVGIENVEEARQPFFTTKPDMDRSGMGFSFMETFMDEVEVTSKVGQGTIVAMKKYIGVVGEDEITLLGGCGQ